MTTIDITEEGHYFSAWSTKREPANDTVFFTDDWIMPFDYRYDGGMGARDYYDENNGWTYLWQPYHAFNDLIAMTGGPEKFDARLFNKPLITHNDIIEGGTLILEMGEEPGYSWGIKVQ